MVGLNAISKKLVKVATDDRQTLEAIEWIKGQIRSTGLEPVDSLYQVVNNFLELSTVFVVNDSNSYVWFVVYVMNSRINGMEGQWEDEGKDGMHLTCLSFVLLLSLCYFSWFWVIFGFIVSIFLGF